MSAGMISRSLTTSSSKVRERPKSVSSTRTVTGSRSALGPISPATAT